MQCEDGFILLDLIQTEIEDGFDIKLAALEQLCISVLQVDSAETLKKLYPPASYVPVLAHFFLDLSTPATILESSTRVFTYFLQTLPFETSASLVDQEAIFFAISIRMTSCDLNDPVENDLAQQIVKLLEEYCKREICVPKLIRCLQNILDFVLNNWHKIHLDTLTSGLFVVSRLSNYVDKWISNDAGKQNYLRLVDFHLYEACTNELRGWIFKLVHLVLHHNMDVTFGSLECLRNIVVSCRRLPRPLNPLDRVLEDGRLLDSLLILLSPNPQAATLRRHSSDTLMVDETSSMTFSTGSSRRQQLTGPLAALVSELILNLCHQESGVLKSLISRPIFASLLRAVLLVQDDVGDERISQPLHRSTSITPKNLDSQLVTPILNFIDGLLFLAFTMPMESIDGSPPHTSQVERTSTEHSEVQPEMTPASMRSLSTFENFKTETATSALSVARQRWYYYIKMRTAIVQSRGCLSGTTSAHSTPPIDNAFSALRSSMDSLGLSMDNEISSLRFHLLVEHALVNKTNIVDLIIALGCAQLKHCWTDPMGQSILSWAVYCNYPAAMMALFNRGADINAGIATTPLHVAAGNFNSACIQLLLSGNLQMSLASAVNPCLRDIDGLTPRDRCKLATVHTEPDRKNQQETEDLLKKAEDDFKSQYTALSKGTAGKLMELVLPVLINVYKAGMRPILREQALRLITRICRSKSGYAMLRTLSVSQGASSTVALHEQLVEVISSALSQGCPSEASLCLGLIPALIDHPDFSRQLQRYGIMEILSWRIAAETTLMEGEEHNRNASEWMNFVPPELTDPQELDLSKTLENPACGSIGCQCLYELCWDQPYQFGDWTILRLGSSSLIFVQEFAALYIEVVRAVASEPPGECLPPGLLVYLITRRDTSLQSKNPSFDQDKSNLINGESLNDLEMKSLILDSGSGSGQLPLKDKETLWAQCEKCINKIRGCTLGLVPLPLSRFAFDTDSRSQTPRTGPVRKPHAPFSAPRIPRTTVKPVVSFTNSVEKRQLDDTVEESATLQNSPSENLATDISPPSLICQANSVASSAPSMSESVRLPANFPEGQHGEQEGPLNVSSSLTPPRTVEDEAVAEETILGATTSDGQILFNLSTSHETEQQPPCSLVSSTSSETDQNSDQSLQSLTHVSMPNRMTLGLLLIALSPCGLSISLREVATSDPYLNIGLTNADQRIVCDHIECRGLWNPDIEESIETQDDTKESECKPNVGVSMTFKPKMAKVIVAPAKIGGVRFYKSDGSLAFKSNSLARGARLARIHPAFAYLNIHQRQALRACHRMCHLQKMRSCIVRRGSQLAKVLMSQRDGIEASKNLQLLMELAGKCRTLTKHVRSNPLGDRFSMIKVTLLHGPRDETKLISGATPYEVISSEVVTELLTCLQTLGTGLGDVVQLFETGIISEINNVFKEESTCDSLTPQLLLVKLLFGTSLHAFIHKIVQTFDLFERYAVTSLHFTDFHNQLLHRPIQFQPKLRVGDRSLEKRSSSSELSAAPKPYARKVDLSDCRICAAPLVNFEQLIQCLETKIEETPWYMDALEDMAFVHDLQKEDRGIYLLPPEEATTGEQNYSGYKSHLGGIFHWIGSNGGRELKSLVNPTQLRGLVKITTSDETVNHRLLQLKRLIQPDATFNPDDTTDPATTESSPSVPAPQDAAPGITIPGKVINNSMLLNRTWIGVDVGVDLEITHYRVWVPKVADTWPELRHWQLEASKKGFTWNVLSEHHIYPSGHPESFWGSRCEHMWPVNAMSEDCKRESYRFFRIVLLPSKSIREIPPENSEHISEVVNLCQELDTVQNVLKLQKLEFYGRVLSVHCSPVNEETASYIAKFKPGVLIIPNRPQKTARTLVDVWPSPRSSFHDDGGGGGGSSPSEHLESSESVQLPSLGLVLSGVELGCIQVIWLQSLESQSETTDFECRTVIRRRGPETSTKDEESSQFNFRSKIQTHTMSHELNFELSLPTVKNVTLEQVIDRLFGCEQSSQSENEENKLNSGAHCGSAGTTGMSPEPESNIEVGNTLRSHYFVRKYSVIDPQHRQHNRSNEQVSLRGRPLPRSVHRLNRIKHRPWYLYKFPYSVASRCYHECGRPSTAQQCSISTSETNGSQLPDEAEGNEHRMLRSVRKAHQDDDNNCAIDSDLMPRELTSDLRQNEEIQQVLNRESTRNTISLDYIIWVTNDGQPDSLLPFTVVCFPNFMLSSAVTRDEFVQFNFTAMPNVEYQLDFDYLPSPNVCTSTLSRISPVLNGMCISSLPAFNPTPTVGSTARFTTLDALLPGFVPPFDTRAGAPSHPSTVAFDSTPMLSENVQAPSIPSGPRIRVWFTQNGTEMREDTLALVGPLLPTCHSLKTAEFTSQIFVPDSLNLPIFHCWTESLQLEEEFPGSGKPKRPGSPISCSLQKGYCLNYTTDDSILPETGPRSNTSNAQQNLAGIPFVTNWQTNSVKTSFTVIDEILGLLAILYTTTTDSGSMKAFRERLRTPFVNRPSVMVSADLQTEFSDLIPCPKELFFSARLAHKVYLFTRSTWSVIQACGQKQNGDLALSGEEAGMSMYTWCRKLIQQAWFLFPLEVRLDFWRATSLGLSRSVAWLQKESRLTNQSMGNSGLTPSQNIQTNSGESGFGSLFGASSSRFSASDFGGVWGASVVLQKTLKSNGANKTLEAFPLKTSAFSHLTGSTLQSPGWGSNTPGSLTSLGRLQHECAKVPRPLSYQTKCVVGEELGSFVDEHNDDGFWRAAKRLLISHSDRKQELEVGFDTEEGTGVGPTMEFYALLSAELRKQLHALWVDDYSTSPDKEPSMCSAVDHVSAGFELSTQEQNLLSQLHDDCEGRDLRMEVNEMKKSDECGLSRAVYVTPKNGLFPSAWPANALLPQTQERFQVLGIAVAKCLQDQRRMDMPFSESFLKLLVRGEANFGSRQVIPLEKTANPFEVFTTNIPHLEEFIEVYPEQGDFFLRCLVYLNCRKATLMTIEQVEELEKQLFSAKLCDLCLSMEFAAVIPVSGVYAFPLQDFYDWELTHETSDAQLRNVDLDAEALEITFENLESYIRRTVTFAMDKGIRRQVDAFKDGFNRVFPIETLSIFSATELGQLIAGEDTVPRPWIYDEMFNVFEPVAGYSYQSPGFLLLLRVLSTFNGIERRAFVKFITGSPNLPPGGFANLFPALKVAKKDARAFGPYPSVNTCMHYLKLPEYETEAELRVHLLAATNQTGFYLN